MGEVYLARILGVEGFSKWVALKRIYPHLHRNNTHRGMFIREAKLLAGLTHPNIVQVLELGTTNDELFMAMELVHGTDLARLLRSRFELGQGLDEDTVAVIAFDLLEALDYAHTYRDDEQRVTGVVHADVSPQNVMLSTLGYAKLCDFGVSKTLRHTCTEATMHRAWGKRAYAAPEILRGTRPDALSDIYSLGVVLHECLTARPLFEAKTSSWLAAIVGPTANLREARPDLSTGLADIIERAMAKDPRERYASAREMRHDVEQVLLAAGPSAARERLRSLVASLYTPIEQTRQHEGTEVLRPSEVMKASEVQQPSVRWTALTQRATNAPTPRPVRRRMTIERRAVAAGGAFLAVTILGLLGVSLAKPSMREPEVNTRSSAVTAADTPQPPQRPTEPSENARKSKPRPTKPRPAKEVVAEETGTLNINALPWAYVTIDGHKLPEPTPVTGFRVPAGRHVVLLEGPSFGSERLVVDVGPGEMISRTVHLVTR